MKNLAQILPRHNSLLTLTALIATALLMSCSSTEPSNEGESSSSGMLISSSTIPTYSQGDAPLAKNDQSCEFDEAANLLKCKEKEYKTVKIGEQIWMAENLDYGEFISTEDIEPNGYSRFQIGSVKFCYDNDESNCDHYGGLYQWHTAMGLNASCSTQNIFCGDQINEGHHQGICPKGWHVPIKEEVVALMNLQYNFSPRGGASFFLDSSAGGTNETGFSALLSGECSFTLRFRYLKDSEWGWTATTSTDEPGMAVPYSIGTSVYVSTMSTITAKSVRCLKDN